MANLKAHKPAAFALWLLVAGSAVFWLFKFAPQPSVPGAVLQALAGSSGASASVVTAPEPALLARTLGAVPASAASAPKAPSLNAARYALTGVVRPSSARQGADAAPGLALIAIDGRPARLYQQGSWLEEGVALQAVGPRSVSLALSPQGPSALTLELSRIKRAGRTAAP